MLPSKANWLFREKQDLSPAVQDESMQLSSIVLQLLQQRNITTVEDIQHFMSPLLSDLYEPINLSMIDLAAERIHQAITHEEKILVYGDYDADGVSSTALLLQALKELGAICDFYIPNRFTEGYGLNEQAIKDAYKNGYQVIVTVDTGIASIAEADIAKSLGMDLIITDHHELQEELPDAYAIINPKCSPNYPFSELAGVGVAFKLAQQLLGYFPEHLLDYVAIGTIADLVPLVDENRILAYHGLKLLSTTTNIGLQALKKVCQLEGPITEEHVGFSIGPRLNAVGRIQDASLAVELLITEDADEAKTLAEMVQSVNEKRQQIVSKIVREAEEMTRASQVDNVIVVAKEGWNEGVLGIVASRLVRKYDRPAIVLTIKSDQGVAKGSARSITPFNLFENCMRIKDLFTQFGGHAQAAGMTLPLENVDDLRVQLNKQINDELTEDDFKQVIEISDDIEVSDINEQLIPEINQLAPFGMGNPKPIFCLTAHPTDVRQIGSLKNHLKLQFKENDVVVEGIGFSLGEAYAHLSPYDEMRIVGELGINEWNGIRKPQIIIQDLCVDAWQLFDHRGKKETNISTYLKTSNGSLIISEKELNLPEDEFAHVVQMNYPEDIDRLHPVDSLFLYDLPPTLSVLEDMIRKTQPANVHLLFQLEDSKYLQPIPTRADFKWFYSFAYQHQSVDLKKAIPYVMRTKKWTKDFIIFMAKVFLELKFVRIESSIMTMEQNPEKREIQSSQLYQTLQLEVEIEKALYYSNYQQLKTWFSKLMTRKASAEEEVVHGL